MQFRTHLGRPIDLKLVSNALVVGIAGVTAIGALIVWLDGGGVRVWLAPAAAGIYWALNREIDPDHPWTAVAAAAFAGGWLLTDVPTASLLAVGGLMVAARLTGGTTGRRPLLSDLLVLAVGGTAISFTVEGWVGGFSLAIGMLLDARYRDAETNAPIVVALLTAVGATLVLTLGGGLPATFSPTRPAMIVIGLIALALIVREPSRLSSLVDARHQSPLDKNRIHAGRLLVGLAFFVMTAAAGLSLSEVLPAAVAMGLAVVSNELPWRKTE